MGDRASHCEVCCTPCEAVPVTAFALSVGKTAQAGSTSTTLVMDASETFADDDLIGGTVEITSGKGNGQTRTISDNTGATDTLTVDTAWTTTPDNTSVYTVRAKDNGDKTFTITGTKATPEQNVAASAEAYQFHLAVSDDCTVNVEGFAITVDVNNQQITLNGNTENWANATEVGGDPVDLHVYVCPDFVYVAALRTVLQSDYSFTTGGGDDVAMGGENGTCLIADFGSPPYSIVPDWSVETTGTVTMSPVHNLTDIESWPETFKCTASVVTTDCSRGPRPIIQHYGFMVASADLDLAVTGFEYDYTAALAAVWLGTGWSQWESPRWEDHSGPNDFSLPNHFNKPALAAPTLGYRQRNYTMHWTAYRNQITFQTSPANFYWTPQWAYEPVSTFGSGVLDLDNALFSFITDDIRGIPATGSAYPTGPFDQVTYLHARVVWTIDDADCTTPYPRPKFVASNEIIEDGYCYDSGGTLVDPLLESWSRDGITSSDIAINSLSAGFTIATSTTWSGCSGAYGGSSQQFTQTGADSSSQVTTVTWTV